jgi:hypothetical protein
VAVSLILQTEITDTANRVSRIWRPQRAGVPRRVISHLNRRVARRCVG